MSKSQQLKLAAYQQGVADGKAGRFRWSRHPFMDSYKAGIIAGKAQRKRSGFRFGILFRWQSWWIGGRWSPYNKRLCVNLIPLVTIWIAWPGGITPDQGNHLFRSDGLH